MRVIIAVSAVIVVLAGTLITVGALGAFMDQRSATIEQYIGEDRFQEALPLAERQVRAYRLAVDASPGNGFRGQLALALNYLGFIKKHLGLLLDAEAHYVEAIALAREAGGERTVDYANYTNNLAVLLHEQGYNDRALPLATEVVEIRREVLGEAHPSYAVALNNLGSIQNGLGDFEAALSNLEAGQAILEEHGPKGDQNYRFLLNNLADVHMALGNTDDAIAVQRHVIAVSEEVHGKASPEYALGINNLAYVFQQAYDYEEAMRYYTEARDCFEALGQTNSHVYAVVLSNLAYMHAQEGEYPQSETYLRQALEIQETVIGKLHPSYLEDLESLATACDMQDKLEEAEQCYREAAALTAEGQGVGSDAHLARLESIAWFFDGNERMPEAEAAMQEAVAVALDTQGAGSVAYTAVLESLCLLLRYSDDPERAEPHYATLGAALLQNHGPLSQEHLQFALDQVDFQLEQEKHAEAEAALDALLTQLAEAGPEHRIDHIQTLTRAGYFHQEQENFSRAESHFTLALAGWANEAGKETEDYSNALWDLASLYWTKKQYESAVNLLEEMVAIDRVIYADDPEAVARSLQHLANFYLEQQRDRDAEPYLREALAHYQATETPNYSFYARMDCTASLVGLLTRRGAFEEGLALLDGLATVQQAEYPEYTLGYARTLALRAGIFQAQGGMDDAEKALAEAKAIFVKEEATDYPDYADLCRQLADFYTATGRPDDAARILGEIPEMESPDDAAADTQADPNT